MNRYIVAVLLLGALPAGVSAQSAYAVGNVSVETIRDSVWISLTVTPGTVRFPSGSTLALTPGIRSENQGRDLEPLVFRGRLNQKKYDRAVLFGRRRPLQPPTNAGITGTDYRAVVLFEEWMRGARLEVTSRRWNCESGDAIVRTIVLADRIPAPEPPAAPVVEEPVPPPPPSAPEIKEVTGSAYLDYAVGSSVIRPDFHDNYRELSKIRTALDTLLADPHAKIVSVELVGYASPEGSTELNDRLAMERAAALKNYLKANYTNLPAGLVTVRSGGEDWDGLRRLAAASAMRDKGAVLGVLDSDRSDTEKKVQLRALGGGAPYAVLLRDFYPQLRRVEYTIDYEVVQ